MARSLSPIALGLATLAALQFVPLPALASGKPLALALSPPAVTLTEGQSATFALSKSGGNGRAVAVRVTTSDGSFSASVAPGSSFTVPTRDDALVNGTRTIVVTATASTGASAKATITELDNDVAPVPAPAPAPVAVLPAPSAVKCADEGGVCSIVGTAFVFYGAGSAWLRLAATTAIACDNATFTDPAPGVPKSCVTDGQLAPSTAPAPTPAPPPPAPAPSPSPTPVPPPPPPTGPVAAGWTAVPLGVGVLACNRLQAGHGNVPACGGGILVRITGTVPNAAAAPNGSYPADAFLYTAVFAEDASGQFPVTDALATGAVGYWPPGDLQGVAEVSP